MHNLEDIQNKILENIVSSKKNYNLDFIKNNILLSYNDNLNNKLERFNINKNTVIIGLVDILKDIYPGIWKLLGTKCAEGVALVYSHSEQNLRDRHNINYFGHNFPEYLKSFESTKNLFYLPDYALKEWLYFKSYKSKNDSIILNDEINKFLLNDIENCKITFNSSVFLQKSPFALYKIENLLENDNKMIESIMGDSFIVICKINNKVEIIYLEKHYWDFLYSLKSNNTIGKSIEFLCKNNIQNQITNIVNIIIKKGMIKRIYNDV